MHRKAKGTLYLYIEENGDQIVEGEIGPAAKKVGGLQINIGIECLDRSNVSLRTRSTLILVTSLFEVV